MSVRHLLTVTAAVWSGSIALAAPAIAQSSVQPFAAATGMTSGRFGPTLTALVALIGVVIGGLALRSAGRTGKGEGRALVALGLGLIGVTVGGLFAVTADGGPGTGNGIVGAFAAMVFGLMSMALGGLTVVRARRTV